MKTEISESESKIFLTNRRKPQKQNVMKKVQSMNELIDSIKSNNHCYDRHFDTYFELLDDCKNFFKENTQDLENQQEYYEQFGLDFGDCFIDKVKTESYFNEEENCVNTVHFMEGYIDSGVPAESYYYGFYITD